jgi:hypothetical protein
MAGFPQLTSSIMARHSTPWGEIKRTREVIKTLVGS